MSRVNFSFSSTAHWLASSPSLPGGVVVKCFLVVVIVSSVFSEMAMADAPATQPAIPADIASLRQEISELREQNAQLREQIKEMQQPTPHPIAQVSFSDIPEKVMPQVAKGRRFFGEGIVMSSDQGPNGLRRLIIVENKKAGGAYAKDFTINNTHGAIQIRATIDVTEEDAIDFQKLQMVSLIGTVDSVNIQNAVQQDDFTIVTLHLVDGKTRSLFDIPLRSIAP